MKNIKVFSAINLRTDLFRYVETILKLVLLRITQRPDVYVLGFRGAELFWLVRLITLGKPLIYDEFINPYLWAVEEHKKIPEQSLRSRILKMYVRGTLNTSDLVLSDTAQHMRYSSQKFEIPLNKFRSIYVGTDEDMFYNRPKITKKDESFTVFFYGNFLPLHGMDHIIEAANQLRAFKKIKFIIVGGAKRKKSMKNFLSKIKELKLTNIEHKTWVKTNHLPEYINNADLCLGGPFGATPQAHKVITGKTFQFLAMAKPTMVGRIDDVASFVDRKNCLLVGQGNPDDLARQIAWAYKNQDRLSKIGESGHELYKNEFSQSAQSKKLHDAILSVL